MQTNQETPMERLKLISNNQEEMNIQSKSAQNKRTQPDNEDVQNPEQHQKAKKNKN